MSPSPAAPLSSSDNQSINDIDDSQKKRAIMPSGEDTGQCSSISSQQKNSNQIRQRLYELVSHNDTLTFDEFIQQNASLIEQLSQEQNSRRLVMEHWNQIMDKEDRELLQDRGTEADRDVHEPHDPTTHPPPPENHFDDNRSLTGEYRHWLDHYENGFQLDAEWYVPDADEEEFSDLLSELSMEPVYDDAYFEELKIYHEERKEYLILKQIQRVLKDAIPSATHQQKASHPQTTDEIQNVIHHVMMNLLSPPRSLLWIIRTNRLSKISQLYSSIDFRRNNPCYKDLMRTLLLLRAKWRVTAPTLVELLRSLFEYCGANKTFMSMIQHGKLSKLVSGSLEALNHMRRQSTLLKNQIRNVEVVVEDMDTILEHSLERIEEKQQHARQKYESLVERADISVPSHETIEKIGFEAYKDRNDSLISKRITEHNKLQQEKENCERSIATLKQHGKSLQMVVQLVHDLEDCWNEIEQKMNRLKSVKDKLFTASNMNLVGYLVAERWDDTVKSVGNFVFQLLYGKAVFMQRLRQREFISKLSDLFVGEGNETVQVS